LGDLEQDFDGDSHSANELSENSVIKKKAKKLLNRLNNYDFLVSKNLYFEEKEQFPKLQLDF